MAESEVIEVGTVVRCQQSSRDHKMPGRVVGLDGRYAHVQLFGGHKRVERVRLALVQVWQKGQEQDRARLQRHGGGR